MPARPGKVRKTEKVPELFATIKVHLQPGASRNEVVGFQEGMLKVRVSAPPVGGKANEALVELLAQVLHIPRSRVHILRGHTSRNKVVQVEGTPLEEVVKKLAGG